MYLASHSASDFRWLILRSSDNVTFRVRKAILAEASPVFEDMFKLPAPQSQSLNEPPVVDMMEDSRALKGLLRLCYPIRRTPIRTLDEAIMLLDAAKKYSMDGALTYLGERLALFAKAQPVRVYALAIRHQLREEVIMSARPPICAYLTIATAAPLRQSAVSVTIVGSTLKGGVGCSALVQCVSNLIMTMT